MPGPPALRGPPAQLLENLVLLALSDGASNDDRPRDGSSHDAARWLAEPQKERMEAAKGDDDLCGSVVVHSLQL